MIGPIREAERGEWEIRTQFNKLSEQHVEGDVNSGVAYVRVVIHGTPQTYMETFLVSVSSFGTKRSFFREREL